MGKSDLGGQFEREVRSLYPEGKATEAERGLLFDLARAKGLSSAEAQMIVERCLGPSTSSEGPRLAGGTDATRDTYELSSDELPATPVQAAPPRPRGTSHKTTVILVPPRPPRSVTSARDSRERKPEPEQDPRPAEMESPWPVSHLVIAGVALVVLVMVLLLIWRLAT